jgi:hypothetical protein
MVFAAIGALLWYGLRTKVSPAEMRSEPLTLTLTVMSDFQGGNYELTVDDSGQGRLQIDTYPMRTTRQFQVSYQQLAEFRETLIHERFFELRSEYGEIVPDGGQTTLTVSVGEHRKSIDLHFFGNWRLQDDRAKLSEPSRALRIVDLVSSWCQLPQ